MVVFIVMVFVGMDMLIIVFGIDFESIVKEKVYKVFLVRIILFKVCS